jgi:hypothetical protein
MVDKGNRLSLLRRLEISGPFFVHKKAKAEPFGLLMALLQHLSLMNLQDNIVTPHISSCLIDNRKAKMAPNPYGPKYCEVLL